MNSRDIRKKFLSFFKERGHAIVPSSSLLPTDPSVLLTTAGMQQFKPYFTGERDAEVDFGSNCTASIQKSFRTSDIGEVGDETHLTFFEMLGNFSFSAYFKKEAIQYAYEFLTQELDLEIDYVTVFEGDADIPADEESERIWADLGVDDVRRMNKEENFWGPTGSEGPCGPTTEVYMKNSAGESVEIWNVVFNEFYCDTEGNLTELKTKGIDTGMGLERLAMIAQQTSHILETDLFKPLEDLLPSDVTERERRIFADHTRAICFLVADGVRPSNKEQGYILRRLIRHVIALHDDVVMVPLFEKLQELYGEAYPELDPKLAHEVFTDERKKFQKALNRGLKELQKMESIDAESAFKLYQSFGLPYDVIKARAGEKAKDLTEEAFEEEFQKHQEISRAGAEEKFGGHGLALDTGELKAKDDAEKQAVLKLHTATHMLQQALREVLGDEVTQAGSNINAKRTRFDFTFPRKVEEDELKEVERIVNQKIAEDLPVQFEEMPKEEAEQTGALSFFKAKYPDVVKVYYIGDSLESAWSKEFCGGPHVKHSGEIGGIEIFKEESASAGVRRIRARLTE